MSSAESSPSPVPTSSAPQTPNTPPPVDESELPQFEYIPKTVFLTDAQFLARGGHSHVYTVTMWIKNRSRRSILKVFTSRHKQDYLDEVNAYRHLYFHGIIDEGIVPRIFGIDKWGVKQFKKTLRGAEIAAGMDFPVRVILMEYLEEAEELREENVTLDMAMKALRGIRRIHLASVKHGDVAPRNILVLPSGRVVWIDFSSAQCNASHYHRAVEYEEVKDLFFEELVRWLFISN
jgi:predicted Ser/Thr protein kinase